MDPYYLAYVAQPVLCKVYPPSSSSPAWTMSPLAPSPGFATPKLPPTPTLAPIPLPPCSHIYLIGHARRPHPRSPPQKIKREPRASVPPRPALRSLPLVDPLIARTRYSSAAACFRWDLQRDPLTLHTTDVRPPPFTTVTWADFATRPAARAVPEDGGQPLRSLVLVFPHLPLQAVVVPSPCPLKASQANGGDYVSVWDVLTQLYNFLRAPIDWTYFNSMSRPDQDVLRQSASRRAGELPEDKPHLIRNVDFLCTRRQFLGIRVAEPHELPKGRRLGEVFVVAVGSG